MNPETKKGEFEIVMPSDGRFARMRKMKWLDMLIACAAGQMMLPTLASRIVTIDEQTFTPEEWADMDFDDVAPIAAEISRRFGEAMKNKGVA